MSAPLPHTVTTCGNCPHSIVLMPTPDGRQVYVHTGTWLPNCYRQATTATAPGGPR